MEDPDTDPEVEWSIEQCSSKENNGKLRWMLDKGLTVGKKILVTGFVISSAPIVLPPLAVVSIIGFACSVPYGLFLASYACTNKLMSKLLPEPKPPRYLLEYDGAENDGNGEEGEDLGLYGYFGRDKEEEDMWEDARKNVEMRIKLVENDESDAYGKGGFRKNEQELVNDNETVEENGYEEDIGGDLDEELMEEIELKIGGLGEEEGKQPVVDVVKSVVDIKRDETSNIAVERTGTTFKVTNVIVDFRQDADINEDEEIVRKTTGLLEKIGEEGMAENGEENNRSVEKPSGGAEEGDLRVDSRIEVMRMPETVYVQNVDVIPKDMEPKPVAGDLLVTRESEVVLEAEKPTGEMSGTRSFGFAENVVGDLAATKETDEILKAEKPTGEMNKVTDEVLKAEEPTGEMSGTSDFEFAENVEVVPGEMNPKAVIRDLAATKESDEVLEAEKSTSEMSGTTDIGGNLMAEQKPLVRKRKASSQQEGRANDNNTKDAQRDSQLNRKNEIVITTNADAREIADESGFDLFDTNNVAAQQYSDEDFITGEDVASTKNKQSSSLAVLKSVDLMDLPVNAGDHDHDDTGISSKKNMGMNSGKQVYTTEEKILEKIEAMRMIVGYKAARQVTCLEELKALYLFTGVEPPALFKDPSDLMEVNDKLRFLMSIIGVK